jgi:hypothetical protein
MKKFTHTEVFAEGFLACGITKSGAKVKVPILECRAGVVGPTGGRPGYAVFFGLRMERNISGKNPLIFLHEIEKKTPGSFLDKLTDDGVRFRCSVLYADRGAHRGIEGFYGFLWRYINDRGLNISLIPAPSVEDPSYGVSLVQEALATKSLELPERETILKSNLKQVTIENLNDESPSFNSCRYLLAGFEKFPYAGRPAFAQGGMQPGRRNIDRRDSGGWT